MTWPSLALEGLTDKSDGFMRALIRGFERSEIKKSEICRIVILLRYSFLLLP